MTNESAADNTDRNTHTGDDFAAEVIYREKHWVPWYFWLMALGVVALTSATMGLNRPLMWTVIPFIVLSIVAVWGLISWSGTTIRVERDADGTRWLVAKGAQLPHDVVNRSLGVPKSARRNALGPQLDPAAFLVTTNWVDELAMFVLDDPEDPTPYWLISTKDPAGLIQAFVPDQADAALQTLRAAKGHA